MSARIGWAAMVLGAGRYPGKPVNARRQLVHGREEVDRRVAAGPQMQVKLIDRLEVGDLEEEACGRRRRHGPTGSQARRGRARPGWRVESSDEP